MERDHTIILVSKYGKNKHLLRVVDILKERKIPFLVITSKQAKELSLKTPYVLYGIIHEEFESLKLEHESLVKNYEDIKSKNDKLTIENKDLSKKIKDNEANSQIAVTQMSFDTIGDNNLKDEILNLDLLNMTPLDAINALYSLQKKAKNN